MSHDTHFLERLERLDDADVRFAFALYRDPALVRRLIETCAPPDAERVAIAVRHKPGGPHLLVSSNGHFVTCLGANMKTELPTIPRAAVDVLSTRERRYRDLLAEARNAKDPEPPPLVKLLDGSRPTREDIARVVAWTPLFTLETIDYLVNAFDRMRSLGARFWYAQSLKRRHEADIRLFCHLARAIGHLSGPATESLALASASRATSAGSKFGGALMRIATATHLPATLVRTTCAISVHGPLVFEQLGHGLEDELLTFAYLACTGAMVASALRHPALQEPARRRFAELLASPRAADHAKQALREQLAVLDDPRAALARYHDAARAWVQETYDEPPPLTDEEAMAARLLDHAAEHRITGCWSTDALAYAAVVDFADTYLPAHVDEAFPAFDDDDEFAYADTRRVIEQAIARLDGRSEPEAAAKPGRNEPCHCGSGKKFKRCHGG